MALPLLSPLVVSHHCECRLKLEEVKINTTNNTEFLFRNYYKVGRRLIQSGPAFCCYKVRRKLLQSGTGVKVEQKLLQSGTCVTKCGDCYIVGCNRS